MELLNSHFPVDVKVWSSVSLTVMELASVGAVLIFVSSLYTALYTLIGVQWAETILIW